MRVTLQQLKALIIAANTKSVTYAAKEMALTQPAVSNLLRQLEQAYGTALTEYNGRNLALTQAGEVVYKGAQQIQNLLEQTESDVHAIQGELNGVMRVSVVSTAKYFMPRLLGQFKQDYPNISPVLKVFNREQVLQRLKEDQDDFVIMSQPPKNMPVVIDHFYEDELVVAAHPKTKNAYAKPLSLTDLAKENWLIRESGSGTRIVMDKLFRQHNLSPRISMELGNNESIKQMIIAGMGISIVSLQSIELEIRNQLIDILPVQGLPLHHQWYMVTRKNKQNVPLTQAFKSFIQAHPELAHCNYTLVEKLDCH